MASNTYNINIGNGETIAVPSWAQEETLQKILNEVRQDRSVSQEVARAIRDVGLDADEFEESLKLLKDNINEAAREEKNATKKMVDAAKRSGKNIAGHFQNTERPLTAMTGILGSLAEGAGGMTASFLQGGKYSEQFAKLSSGIGDTAKAAGTAFMTWLGWNAAKMEQYAEVQQSMIDSGAIMFSTAGTFKDLYRSVQLSGITYAQFANTISSFGYGISGLGKDVSSGALAFRDLITGKDGILAASDKFGDWGMTHDQLMNVYANYIETQVKNGFINNNLIASKGELNRGFHNLMAETTALASLTGKSRSEIMSEMLAGMSDIQQGVVLSELRESFPDVAKNAEESLRALSMLESTASDPATKQMMASIREALIVEMGVHSADPSRIDIINQLSSQNPVLANMVSDSGLADMLNSIGDGSKVGIDSFVKLFREGKFKDLAATFAKTSGAAGEFADTAYDLARLETHFTNLFRGYNEKVDGSFQDYLDKIAKDADKAGKSTVAMNNMTTALLTAQEAITADMESGADVVKEFSETVLRASKWINDQINGRNNDPLASPVEFPEMSKEEADDWYRMFYLPASQGYNPMISAPYVDDDAKYERETQVIENGKALDDLGSIVNRIDAVGIDPEMSSMIANWAKENKLNVGESNESYVARAIDAIGGVDALNQALGEDSTLSGRNAFYKNTEKFGRQRVTEAEYNRKLGKTPPSMSQGQRMISGAYTEMMQTASAYTTDNPGNLATLKQKLDSFYTDMDIQDVNSDGRVDFADLTALDLPIEEMARISRQLKMFTDKLPEIFKE